MVNVSKVSLAIATLASLALASSPSDVSADVHSVPHGSGSLPGKGKRIQDSMLSTKQRNTSVAGLHGVLRERSLGEDTASKFEKAVEKIVENYQHATSSELEEGESIEFLSSSHHNMTEVEAQRLDMLQALEQHPHGGLGGPGAQMDFQPHSVQGGGIPSPEQCYPLLCPFHEWKSEDGKPQVSDDLHWLQAKCAHVKGCTRKANYAKCARWCRVLEDKFVGEKTVWR